MRVASSLVPLSLVLALVSPGSAQEPRARPMEVEDVLSMAAVSDTRISPDGRRVAYVVTERDFERGRQDGDLWLVPTGGGSPLRLTHADGSVEAPDWSADGERIAFLSDRGSDDGSRQVYAMRPDGGEAWAVTEWKRGVDAFALSPDGAWIAFVAKPEKSEAQEAFEEERGRPDVWDHYYPDEWAHFWVAPLENGRAGEPRRLSPDGLFVSDVVWSPDSARLAFSGRPSPALRTRRDAAVYVVDAAGGDARRITDMPGGESPVAWSATRGVIVSGSGKLLGTFNQELWAVSPEGGTPTSLTDALDENARFVALTEDALYVDANARTGRALFRLGLDGSDPRRLTDERYVFDVSASDDAGRFAFVGESATEPADVYVLEGGEVRRLTDHAPEVRELALGEQRVVSWRSRADGEPIEGVLTLPVGWRDGDEPVPLLLVIHGGPSGVSSDRFSALRSAYPIQVFSGRGYAVLQPNYRGSTGYGERFRGLNRGDISGKDWIDVDSGVDEMIARGVADPERLGIMGWSFGGHHTFWGITQTDRFRAASAGAGANDLISMYSQTDLPEFYVTYLGPRPWEDFELYEERSAYRHVANVVTPLLIQVGEEDERVPAEQSIQFYEAVETLGKTETELVVYPGQPHGVREPRLQRDLLIRNLEWFERWIPAGGES